MTAALLARRGNDVLQIGAASNEVLASLVTHRSVRAYRPDSHIALVEVEITNPTARTKVI